MYRRSARALFALVISLGLIASAGAETKPENVAKHRHAVMEAMGGHVSAIALLAFNQVPDDGEYLANHASSLAALGRELNVLFAPGTAVEDSHALPAIWEEPEKFAAALEAGMEATAAFDEAVAGGDRRAIAGAFRSLGESCKGCHESFREEHD